LTSRSRLAAKISATQVTSVAAIAIRSLRSRCDPLED
jgi:hypothetical protein